MNEHRHFSDEHLNAFIDDQLDAREKAEVADALRHDQALSQRVCKLQKLKNLVQISYQSVDIPEQYKQPSPRGHRRFGWFVAASLFLAVGTLAGWMSHQAMHPSNLIDIAKIQNTANTDNNQHWKLMLNITTSNPNRLNVVLDETEALLQEYAKSSRKLELEILTHREGLALVTDNGQRYNKRLLELQKKYDNLVVNVCGQAWQRLKKQKGQSVNLLPGTRIVPSAISQIMKRQKSGWSYIRI